jgi:hypothetical protein
MVPFAFELADDDKREYDAVLGEAQQRRRVREQHGRVDDVATTSLRD